MCFGRAAETVIGLDLLSRSVQPADHVMVMRAVADPGPELSWLESRAADPEEVTGYDAVGWEASAWVLHAMYEHPGLQTGVTHDDLRRSRLSRGVDRPTVIGGINLDDESTDTGTRSGSRGLRDRRGGECGGRSTSDGPEARSAMPGWCFLRRSRFRPLRVPDRPASGPRPRDHSMA